MTSAVDPEKNAPAARLGRAGRRALAWLEDPSGLRRWHLAAVIGLIAGLLALTNRLPPLTAAAGGLVTLALLSIPFARRSTARPARPAGDRSAGQERWPRILAAISDPAILLDRVGSVLHYNSRAKELFDTLRPGLHVSGVSRSPELIEAIAQPATDEPSQTLMLTEHVPQEQTIRATISVLGQAGAPAGAPFFLITFRDLTEEERLDRMRSDFVANASHELRTPLASLLGFIETLQGPAKNDPAARESFLGIMQSQALRMKRLIDDLMSLSRIEMNAHLRPRDLVDLNEVASHVEETLEPLARQGSITLALEPLDRPAIVRGDWDELVQVVQNLGHNAIKYGRQGGKVSIEVSRRPAPADRASLGVSEIVVAVRDNGPGIDPKHLPRLTERFYRVDVADSRKKGGTGLGLAIVKHVLNRHRGALEITSQLGAGSVFAISLAEATDPEAALSRQQFTVDARNLSESN